MLSEIKIKIDRGVKKIQELADWLKEKIDIIDKIEFSAESDFENASPSSPCFIRVFPKQNPQVNSVDNDFRKRVEQMLAQALVRFGDEVERKKVEEKRIKKEIQKDVEFQEEIAVIEVPAEMEGFCLSMVQFMENHDRKLKAPIEHSISKFRVEMRDYIDEDRKSLEETRKALAEISGKVQSNYRIIQALKELLKD